MAGRWRRWILGSRHGIARSVAVWGAPRPGPGQLADLLGRCQELRAWARALGLELTGVPADLGLLDRPIDEAIGTWGRHSRMSAVGNEAGLFLGTVIVAGVPGARWRLWPNGHPVVRLPPAATWMWSLWPMTG